MSPWPNLKFRTLEGCIEMLQFISRQRDSDITDWNNLQNIFVNGRKVAKIPTGSADVSATDKIGDFNVTSTYAYYLIDNGGTAAWRRVAVGAW